MAQVAPMQIPPMPAQGGQVIMVQQGAPQQVMMQPQPQAGFAPPVLIDVTSRALVTGSGVQYRYYVPNPLTAKFCCGMPCGGDEEMLKKGFFMEFSHGDDVIRYQEAKKGCCSLDTNYVRISRNGQTIGHLEKPFRCCDDCRLSCDECCGSDILLMSFRNETGGSETESYTMRRKGAGCCTAGCCNQCCACCSCGPCCNCKGCCTDCSCGKCCGSIQTPSLLNEYFEIYGPMSEPMDAGPKGKLTVSYRRGLLYGPQWTPVTALIEAAGQAIDESDVLLLLGFAYGMLYQRLMNPQSFPAFMGTMALCEGQGAGLP